MTIPEILAKLKSDEHCVKDWAGVERDLRALVADETYRCAWFLRLELQTPDGAEYPDDQAKHMQDELLKSAGLRWRAYGP